MNSNDIEQLLLKSFTGKTSEAEEQQIADWMAESDDNIREWEQYRKLWDNSPRLHYSRHIDVEKALSATKKRIPQFKSNRRYLRWAQQAAAVLILSFLFSFAINYFRGHQPASEAAGQQLVYQELKAAYGTQTKLALADGTEVWLNSGSSLRFPLSFQGQSNRTVELKGEGYFKVSKDTSRPFVVKAGNLGVKVLGTLFNVNAYENEGHIRVALVEGKVSIEQQLENKTSELLQLNPSEVADYNRTENKILYSKTDQMDYYTGWKDGKIVFSDDSMQEMVHRLENWYNVDIQIAAESLLKYHFTATFHGESLDQVLKYLSLSTSFQYRFVQPKGFDGPDGGKRKIVLYQ